MKICVQWTMWQSFPHPKGTCDYGTCLSSTRPHQAFDVYRNASDTGLGCVLTQKYRVIAMLYELFDIINRSTSNIWSQARSMRLEIYSAANLICNFLSTKSHNETVWSGMQKKNHPRKTFKILCMPSQLNQLIMTKSWHDGGAKIFKHRLS